MKKHTAAQTQLGTSARPYLSQHYLSAGLGLTCTLIPSAASANNTPQHIVAFGGQPLSLTSHMAGLSSGAGQWAPFPVHQTHKLSTQPHWQSKFSLPNTPGSLNLGSSQSNFSLSGLSNVQTLTITVGGKSEVVDLGTKLTGAELLAADQVLSGGHQTLTINAAGAATGGVFDLSNQSLTAIDSSLGGLNALSVPHNVRIVDSLTSLQVSGDLINSGHIIVQPASGNTSTIQAYDITNTAGASISSASQSGHGANLTLVADNQLVNGGLIAAANNLTITAPSVVNSGMLKATHGDINFTSSSALAITNTAGTISALQGNININSAAANGNINIEGGNLLSNQLNINAGTGDVNVNVGTVTGVVNVDACGAHINAATADLQLGAMNVTGDPTYYNQGNVTITGAMAPTDGQALAIVASGNILSDGGSLNTSSITAAGGALLLIAGANFTTSDNSTSGSDNGTTTLTLTAGPGSGGGSLTGGLIDLSGGHGGTGPVTAISTAGFNANAGSVTMLAFAGKGASTGTVTLPQTLTLNTGTVGNGNSGNVVIFAGATKGTAISVGNIDTSQGASGQGIIELAANVPSLVGPFTIKNGAITSGSIGGVLAPTNANITAGNLTTGGGDVFVETKGAFTFNNINTSGQGGAAVALSAGTDGGSAGFVSVVASANITGNNIFAYGGGGGGGSVDPSNNGTNGGNGGGGGPIFLSSSQGSIIIKGMIDSSGGGGGGGGGTTYNGAAGAAGDGGMGGAAGDISLSAVKAFTVTGGIYSADGAFGGGGGLVTFSGGNFVGGSGGGGGASYGGGGGGGAAGNDLAHDVVAGGGGGGGLYGGGGGSGQNPTDSSNVGGNGGGFQTPGAGGISAGQLTNGSDGTKLSGGNGSGANFVPGSGLGGTLGSGGVGGQGFAGPGGEGSNGANVVAAGGVMSGGTLTINSTSATFGTQKVPVTTLVQTLDIGVLPFTKLPNDSFYINNGAGITTSFEVFDTLSIKAAGNITVGAGTNIADNLILTTAPGSNGNIAINNMANAENATLQCDGTGGITTAAGQSLLSNNAILTANTVGTSAAMPFTLGSFNNKVTVNTVNSAFVATNSINNTTLEKSSSTSGDINVSAGGNLIVAGAVTAAAGNVFLNAGRILTVEGAVTAPSLHGLAVLGAGTGMTLEANVSGGTLGATALVVTGSSNILEKKVSINTTTLELGFDAGTVGTAKSPFVTDATTVDALGNATDPNATRVYITDTNTGATLVQNLGNPGNTFNVTSSASLLSIKTGNYFAFNVSNVSKTGSILFVGSGGNDSQSSVSTVGGNVDIQSATLVLNADILTFKTVSGNFGSVMPINLVANHLTIDTGKSGIADFADTNALKLNASTGGNITLSDLQTTIEGPIKATTSLSITDTGSALLSQQTGAIITANSVTLENTGTGNIQSSAAIKASAVTIDSVGGNVAIAGVIGTGKGVVIVDSVNGALTQTSSAELLSGTSVSLSGASIGTPAAAINVTSPSLTLTSSADTLINITGNTVIQNSTNGVGGNLTITSNGSLTQASGATLDVTGNASITAKSFTQMDTAVLGAGGIVRVTTSGTGNAIDLQGMGIVGVGGLAFTTSSKATITVASGTNTLSQNLTIQTGTFDNSGTIQVGTTGTLTISNPTGNLLISNGSGGTITSPLNLTLSSGGNLTVIDSSSGIVPFQSGSANNMTITAKGTLTLPSLHNNLLMVAPGATGNGGTITLKAGSIVDPAGGIDFVANAGPATDSGGNITVTITGKQNVSAESGGPNWNFTANGGGTGGNGGNISITTGGAVFVDQVNMAITNSPLAAGFIGGNISLSAGSNLAIVGTLNSGFMGAGAPGAVTLAANGKSPFVVDKTVAINNKSNGVGSIVGGVVQITNPGGVNVDTGSSVTADSSFKVTASEFTNNGMLTGAATTTIATITNPTGNLTISGNGTWQLNPGNLTALDINCGGNLNAGNLLGTVPVSANDIRLAATGTLTLGTDLIQTPTNVKGLIIITAESLAYSIAMPNPLTLDASGGAASTIGGGVGLLLSGKTNVTLSQTGAGNINIIVSPGAAAPTAGGLIEVITGGNLTVNLSGLQTNNNNVASLNSQVLLQAGGALLVQGWNSNVIGAGGTLLATDKTSNAFVIGTPTTSGINTAGVATGQIIGANLSITNTGGDVSIGGLDYLDAPTAADTVSVTAGKNIVGVFAVESILAGTVNLTSTGGSIGLTMKGQNPNSLGVSALNLTANASKGDVLINQNFAGQLTLGASSGQVFTLQTAQSLVVAGTITAPQIRLSVDNNDNISIANSIGTGKGTVSLSAGLGNITQTAGTINATTLSVFTGASVNNLQTNVDQLNVTLTGGTGNISVNNLGSKLLTIGSGGLLAGNGGITITTAGALTESGPAFALNNLTFDAGGTITINAQTTASTASLNATNGGAVTEGTQGKINCSNSVTMTSDTGNISTAKGSLASPYLVIGTAGNVTLTDSIANGNITVAPITLPVASFSLNASTNAASTVYLNNISTSNGSISMDVTQGTLTLPAGTIIHASSTTAGLGNVNLFVGPPPKTPTVGMQPANIQEAFSGKGQIFYNNSNAISVPTASFLNAFGRNINISGPGTNTIFLDGVTITADPPASASLAAPAGSVIVGTPAPTATITSAPATAPTLPAAMFGIWAGTPSISAPNFGTMPQINWSASTTNSGLFQYSGLGLDTGTDSPFSTQRAGLMSSLSPAAIGSKTRHSAELARGKETTTKVSKVLSKEALLISPDFDTNIETEFGTVFLKRKCLALIISTDKGLTIFNLDDRHSGSLVASIRGEKVGLAPGCHCTVSRANGTDFARVNPAQLIAHRRMHIEEVGDLKIFKSEFHLLSAMSGLKQLRELMISSDPEQKQTAQHLLKTAAILDGLTQGGSEQFELYCENLVTAMNR